MEFYIITKEEQRYVLKEEGQASAVEITKIQLGMMMDYLSFFYKEGTLPLKLRKYVTIYYDDEAMEYVSLSASPSSLISDARLHAKFKGEILVDGFATTLLESEEENRVWIGIDGIVENRGVSGEKVKQVLEKLVHCLNMGTVIEKTIIEKQVDALTLKHFFQLISIPVSIEEGYFDCNQNELDYYQLYINNLWTTVHPVNIQQWQPEATAAKFDLIMQDGVYQLIYNFKEKKIRLIQRVYPWEGSKKSLIRKREVFSFLL